MAVELWIFTLGFVPGSLLRLTPFKNLLTRKQRIWLIVLHAALLLLNQVGLYVATKHVGLGSGVMKVDIFCFGILASAVDMLVLRSYIKEQVFTAGLVMLQDFIVISCVTYLMTRILPYIKPTNLLMIISVYCVVIQLIFYWFFRKLIVSTVKPFLSLQAGDYWNGVWFISGIMFLSCFFALPINVMTDSRYTLGTRLLQYLVIVAVCRSMFKNSLSIKEKLELEKGLSLQQIHYMELANRIEDARKTRHDFKHQITTIHQYLDSGDYDGLKQYCNELQSYHNADVIIPYTGNAAVDGIMYHYASIAKEAGIRFEYRKIVPPAISDIDLCALLGNALDNAIAACRNVEEGAFVKVISNGEGPGMQILIRNSFDGVVKKEGDRFLSRKTEGDHGIGISSMQEICQKNDILMKIAYTENVFDVLFVF